MRLKIYSSVMKNLSKEKRFTFRKNIVLEALKNGIKPTARRFDMSKNTVRLWLRRFRENGNDGLMDRRSGPKHIPHKTSKEVEAQILESRCKASCYGARSLKFYFQLPASTGAIYRVIRDHGLTRRKKRRYQKKNDLRAFKQKYQSLEKFQMDIKYLTDIPPYWEAMQKLGLPRYQYTVRDVKSGMLFLGFANEISELHAEIMVKHVLRVLVKQVPWKIIVQTDNGVEFSGTTRKYENNRFHSAVEALGAIHIYIPPGCCNANADVESIHATIETEFYNLTSFLSRDDFLKKAESYRLFYNLARINYSKGAKTPWLITEQDHSKINLATTALCINVVDLDSSIRQLLLGGQGLPDFPGCVIFGLNDQAHNPSFTIIS